MLYLIKRLLKHRWNDDRAASIAFPPEAIEGLQARVAASELKHSGELRIFIEAGLPLSYLRRDEPIRNLTRERALSLFGKLGVWDTANNNGVLIYLLLAEHAIEIIADRGLNDHVKQEQWQAIIARMRDAFLAKRFEHGLHTATDEITHLLIQHFALEPDDLNPNELPDRPVLR